MPVSVDKKPPTLKIEEAFNRRDYCDFMFRGCSLNLSSLLILQTKRTEWVLNWPGQIVIAGCQVFWTTEVSEALEKKDLDGLRTNLLQQVGCTQPVK